MEEARIFKSKDKDNKDVVLRYTRPSQVVISKGDFVYREYFSKAIRSGIMTSAEANKLLKDRNIWSDEQEQELVSLRIKLLEAEDKLESVENREEGRAIYDEIKGLRFDIEELQSLKKSVSDNTAESVAMEMRTQFFASECVVYNDSGKRVFKDLKDFLARLDEKLTVDSYKHALISNYEQVLGIKMPDTPELPEDKWLNKQVEKLKEEAEQAEAEIKQDAKEEEVADKKPRKRGRKAASS